MSLVYFIVADATKMVKIGVSTSVSRRLIDLQSSCPVSLRVAATIPGDAKIEAAMHRRFAGDRAHNEWFRLSPDILRAIDEINSGSLSEHTDNATRLVVEGRQITMTKEKFIGWMEKLYSSTDWRQRAAKDIGVDPKTLSRMERSPLPPPVWLIRAAFRVTDERIARLLEYEALLTRSLEEDDCDDAEDEAA